MDWNEEEESLLAEVFDQCDRDGSGYITRDQLAALCRSHEQLEEGRLDALMSSLDADNDGHISFEEFKAGFKAYSADQLGSEAPGERAVSSSTPKHMLDHEEVYESAVGSEFSWDEVAERVDPDGLLQGMGVEKVWEELAVGEAAMLEPFENFLSEVVLQMKHNQQDKCKLQSHIKKIMEQHSREVTEMEEILQEQILLAQEDSMQKNASKTKRLSSHYSSLLADQEAELETLRNKETSLQRTLSAKVTSESNLKEERRQLISANEELRQKLSSPHAQTSTINHLQDQAVYRWAESTDEHVLQEMESSQDECVLQGVETSQGERILQGMESSQSERVLQGVESSQGECVLQGVESCQGERILQGAESSQGERILQGAESPQDEHAGSVHQLVESAPEQRWVESSCNQLVQQWAESSCDDYMKSYPPVKSDVYTSKHVESSSSMDSDVHRHGQQQQDLEERPRPLGEGGSPLPGEFTPSATPVVNRVFKVAFLGDSGVGKTSLILQLCEGRFNASCVSTLGLDFSTKMLTVEDEMVVFQLWDTAGQERFRNALTPVYFRRSDAFVIVYDVTNKQSFKSSKSWLSIVTAALREQPPVVMLVGNKTDQHSKREVTSEDGRQLALELHALFSEMSALSGDNVLRAHTTLAQLLLKRENEHLEKLKNKALEITSSSKSKKCSC